MSHQCGSLRVLLVDLLSLSQQLLNVSQHPPLCRRSCLVDHLLGDACQSITSGTTMLMTGGGTFLPRAVIQNWSLLTGQFITDLKDTEGQRRSSETHQKMLVTHKNVCFYRENASLFVLTGLLNYTEAFLWQTVHGLHSKTLSAGIKTFRFQGKWERQQQTLLFVVLQRSIMGKMSHQVRKMKTVLMVTGTLR